VVECQPGESVITPGESDDRFYVVRERCVRVGSSAESAGRIEIGGCFGEAAFAEGSRREVFTVAEGPLTLLKVNRYAARAGVDLLPAALPQGVPARAGGPAAAGQEESRK